MKKKRLFGTDGVRGIANIEITPELAFKLGKAAAFKISKSSIKPTFVIGRDTRISGNLLEQALISGLLSCNADVINVGIVPTPAIAFLIRKYKASAGAMISASHNPFNYNGIKFFDSYGYKLPDTVEDDIQCLIENDFKGVPKYENGNLGIVKYDDSAYEHYFNFLLSTAKYKLNNYKIALDCANGSTYKIAKELFENLGARVSCINNKPNGMNINKNCGSTCMEPLREFILNGEFDIGFAFDGDGDRCLAVDRKGNILNGDRLLSLCGKLLNKKDLLNSNTVVSTVMSNMGLSKSLAKDNIKNVQSKVGDRYVLEEMLHNGYNLGGEDSGHIIFLDYNTTGDGLLTAIQTLCLIEENEISIDDIYFDMIDYPQTLINVKVDNNIKNIVFNDESLHKLIEEKEKLLKDEGRILVRVSGTEPLIRVMVEGLDIIKTGEIAKCIADKIEEIK